VAPAARGGAIQPARVDVGEQQSPARTAGGVSYRETHRGVRRPEAERGARLDEHQLTSRVQATVQEHQVMARLVAAERDRGVVAEEEVEAAVAVEVGERRHPGAHAEAVERRGELAERAVAPGEREMTG